MSQRWNAPEAARWLDIEAGREEAAGRTCVAGALTLAIRSGEWADETRFVRVLLERLNFTPDEAHDVRQIVAASPMRDGPTCPRCGLGASR